jgi:coiled-coil and C2 domain-containing protein 2A
VVVDILRDDRQRETNVHHRIEKKWLGGLTIPFSTLHERERVKYACTMGGESFKCYSIPVQRI